MKYYFLHPCSQICLYDFVYVECAMKKLEIPGRLSLKDRCRYYQFFSGFYLMSQFRK